MLRRSILLLAVTALLLLTILPRSLSTTTNEEDDEDLSFLQEDDPSADTSDGHEDTYESDVEEFDDLEDSADLNNGMPPVDEKDVVILKESNFSDYLESHRFVMVEFYAPWCGHCQALAPEYAEAATLLKEQGVDVTLAKVDGTDEADLAQEYDVDGFPTIHFFSDGAHKPYNGPRSKDSIVNWINKKLGPGVITLATLDEAEKVLTTDSKLALGFFSSVKGHESDELVAASKLDEEVNFYQTENADVAKLFHLDASVKRPALVLVKKEDEKLAYFEGNFSKSEIAKFVETNKNPLVTIFTKESASAVFESDVKKQVILFTKLSESSNILPLFKEASKNFLGKLLFIYVEMDNEDYGKPVVEYFGIKGEEPKVIGYTGNEEAKKFIYDKEITVDNLKAFGADFVEDKLQPFYKSDPVPDKNDGAVKVVVGKSFDEIVLDESKDVLLEIYAPWCGHCQSLEPTYNKLAKHLRGIESLVIAKMDGTTNEHPRAKQDGYPTILLYPAGNKNFDPITMDSDRTVVSIYKFLKKHVSIPFKLQNVSSKPKSSEAKVEASGKDEL